MIVILAMLTLLSITNGSVMGDVLVGQNVLLPCVCENPDDLIWQKGERVVNVYSEDKSSIDGSYKGRSQLFLSEKKENCSLLLLNIVLEDAGEYSCHAVSKVKDGLWSTHSSKVNLTVSEKQDTLGSQVQNEQPEEKPVSAVAIIIAIVAVVVILAVVVTLLIRKRLRMNTDTDLKAQQHMIEEV